MSQMSVLALVSWYLVWFRMEDGCSLLDVGSEALVTVVDCNVDLLTKQPL
jgi:hypothetical protein